MRGGIALLAALILFAAAANANAAAATARRARHAAAGGHGADRHATATSKKSSARPKPSSKAKHSRSGKQSTPTKNPGSKRTRTAAKPPAVPAEPAALPTGAVEPSPFTAAAPTPPAPAVAADGGVAAVEAEPAADLGCLERLRVAGVRHEAAPATRGVRTPVLIQGPIGRVHLVHRERRGRPPLMDCELARALLAVEPILFGLGIDELRYSGAYQYRVRRGTTRLSEHAHGLAIDVHTFHLRDGRELDVQRDFATGDGAWGPGPPDDELACIGAPATDAGRALRTLGCRLRMSSALRTVMTPDDDDDHYNHFHMEAFPDAGTRARIILQRGRARTD